MPDQTLPIEDDSDQKARSAFHMPLSDWEKIIRRVVAGINENRIMLTAGGVTFYLLLALFPALAVFVSIYGFVADPATIAGHLSFLGGVLPAGGLDLVRGELVSLASQNTRSLSFGFLTGLLAAMWSASNGIKAMLNAMTMVYGERDRRSFLQRSLLSVAFTGGGLVTGILLLTLVAVVPAALSFLAPGRLAAIAISWGRWPLLLIGASIVISIIYRFGPSRPKAKWRWLTWGSVLASVGWLATSVGFSFYLEHFADYNATYGSLGAVIAFMVWIWISVIIVLVGAELDAEIENQMSGETAAGVPK